MYMCTSMKVCYQLTHPPLSSIVTSEPPKLPGAAVVPTTYKKLYVEQTKQTIINMTDHSCG